MKSAMKKLLSLVLVAMLLVSAVPFQAAADEGSEAKAKVTVYVTIDGEKVDTTKYLEVGEADEITLTDELAMSMIRDKDGREFVSWTNSEGTVVTGNALPKSWIDAQGEGYFLTVNLKTTPAPAPTYKLTLNANGGTFADGSTKEYSYESGEKVALSGLTIPTRAGYYFAGWFAEAAGGREVTEVDMTAETTLYAHWHDYDKVTVTAVYYKDGIRMASSKLTDWEIPSGSNAFNYVYNNKNVIRDLIPAGYTWGKTSSDEDDYFYTYNNDEKLTSQDQLTNGTTGICVRLYSTDKVNAKVQLYVHTKVGSTATIYDMRDYGYGYVIGDEVYREQVAAVVNKNYKGTNMTIEGLYSDAAWSELCNGKTPTAQKSLSADSANFKVHVIVKNGTTEKADPSNPKTGDMIFVPAIFMLVSGTAIAAVCVYNKKRSAK